MPRSFKMPAPTYDNLYLLGVKNVSAGVRNLLRTKPDNLPPRAHNRICPNPIYTSINVTPEEYQELKLIGLGNATHGLYTLTAAFGEDKDWQRRLLNEIKKDHIAEMGGAAMIKGLLHHDRDGYMKKRLADLNITLEDLEESQQ